MAGYVCDHCRSVRTAEPEQVEITTLADPGPVYVPVAPDPEATQVVDMATILAAEAAPKGKRRR